MANWCVNRVSLSGDPVSVLKAVQLFKKITYNEETNRHPEPAGFPIAGQADMVDFGISGRGLYFRTPWSPAIGTVQQIAEHFKLDYVHRYEEPGMYIYGEASSRNGIFNNICIDRKDTAAITYDERTEGFLYEGRSYADDWEIMIELLDKKRELRDAERRRSDPFVSTGRITKEELTFKYGELSPAELLLKFAEHKNFDGARKEFESWDERSVIETDNLRLQDHRMPRIHANEDQHIADRFLDLLIREWDAKQKPDRMMGSKLSQMELVAWRLAGKLPHIDINGTDFTIDWRLRELRETESPWNSIDISELETGPDSEDYLFFYDTRRHNIYNLDGDITALPDNVVLVELPNEMILDPVAVGREFGGDETMFLEEYPLQQDLKAGIRQLSETFLPEMIAENLRNTPGENEVQKRRTGR